MCVDLTKKSATSLKKNTSVGKSKDKIKGIYRVKQKKVVIGKLRGANVLGVGN